MSHRCPARSGRPRRRGFTLVELAVGFGVLVGVSLFVIESFRFFSIRTGVATEELQQAREEGLLGERLRRTLVITHAVQRFQDHIVLHYLVWADGRWTLESATLRSLGEGAYEWSQAGQDPRRYQLSGLGVGAAKADDKTNDAPGLTVHAEADGKLVAVILDIGGREISIRTRPLVPTVEGLVLAEGVEPALDAWLQELNEGAWASFAPAADDAPGSRIASSGGEAFDAFQEEEGTVPEPSGPTRTGLYSEASALGVELGADGRAILPVRPDPENYRRMDAYDVTQALLAQGYSVEDASLLAVFMAGAELSNRYLRAASLAGLRSMMEGFSAEDRLEQIAELHGDLAVRGDGPGEEEFSQPAALLRGARGADEVNRSEPLPVRFGDAGDDAETGPPPGWNDWIAMLDGLPLTDGMQATLPPGARQRLNERGILDDSAETEATAAEILDDPAVGIPGEFYPPPEAGDDADPLSDLVPRAPDVATAAQEFEDAQNLLDARNDQLGAATKAMNTAQGRVNSLKEDLEDAKVKLAWRKNHLQQQNAAAEDGSCSCPQTRANIVLSNQLIAELDDDLDDAKSALGARKQEQAAAQAAQEAAQTGFNAADAAFEASADGLQGG